MQSNNVSYRTKVVHQGQRAEEIWHFIFCIHPVGCNAAYNRAVVRINSRRPGFRSICMMKTSRDKVTRNLKVVWNAMPMFL